MRKTALRDAHLHYVDPRQKNLSVLVRGASFSLQRASARSGVGTTLRFFRLRSDIGWMHVTQRRLPHHYAIGQPLFVTFRLHGSLPPGRYFAADSMRAGEAFACIDRRWAVGG